MRRILSIALALALPGALAVAESPPAANQSGGAKKRVEIGEWTGSTGATAANVVRVDLEMSGDFEFGGGPGAYRITGSSSGGRVSGELTGPDGKTLFKESYDNLDLKVNAHTFADEVMSAIFGRPGVATTQIAFVSNASGRKEIYLCDSDGSNVRRVTQDNALCVSPSLRSDAVYLAFTSYVTGYPDLYLIDLRSGARRRVITAPGTNSGAAFSPDGERLAMTMSFAGNPELYVTNPGGHGGRRLTKTETSLEACPAWSPDGKRLVYSSNATGRPQLYLMNTGGGGEQRLVTGYAYCTEPSWSPDGFRIAYNVRMGTTISVAIHNLNTGRSEIIAEGEDPCWGADGRHLVYSQGNCLVIRNADSGWERKIVENLGRVSEPSWSR